MNFGTPRNLEEAIKHGLSIGPMHAVAKQTKSCVRDFLAQRFGVACLDVKNDEELARLQKLFESIVEDL